MPNLVYFLPAYNEGAIIEKSLMALVTKFPKALVLLIDNGSTDNTLEISRKVASRFQNIKIIPCPEKGMGHAYAFGYQYLLDKIGNSQTYIVLSASDLPFGFTDVQHLAAIKSKYKYSHVAFVGSKSHPDSKLPGRSFKRTLATNILMRIRRFVLAIKTKDTQGTFVFPWPIFKEIAPQIVNRGYFYTTELVYRTEKAGYQVIEVPIELQPELRKSRVKILRDGWDMIKNIFILRFGR